jgi:hypothetical protein
VVLSASVKLLPVPSMKPLSPLIEYCQVAFDSKLLIVITPLLTTVYDAQVTNLHDGIADEDITYSIEGTNADKFSITTDTGILTYKAIDIITFLKDNATNIY